MGNVGSRPEDGATLTLRDQARREWTSYARSYERADFGGSLVSIASLTVTNSRLKVLLNIVPNAYPASRVLTRKEPGDDSLVAFIQVLLSLDST